MISISWTLSHTYDNDGHGFGLLIIWAQVYTHVYTGDDFYSVKAKTHDNEVSPKV